MLVFLAEQCRTWLVTQLADRASRLGRTHPSAPSPSPYSHNPHRHALHLTALHRASSSSPKALVRSNWWHQSLSLPIPATPASGAVILTLLPSLLPPACAASALPPLPLPWAKPVTARAAATALGEAAASPNVPADAACAGLAEAWPLELAGLRYRRYCHAMRRVYCSCPASSSSCCCPCRQVGHQRRGNSLWTPGLALQLHATLG